MKRYVVRFKNNVEYSKVLHVVKNISPSCKINVLEEGNTFDFSNKTVAEGLAKALDGNLDVIDFNPRDLVRK